MGELELPQATESIHRGNLSQPLVVVLWHQEAITSLALPEIRAIMAQEKSSKVLIVTCLQILIKKTKNMIQIDRRKSKILMKLKMR